MNPQSPQTPLDPNAGDTSDAPVTPMPGESIQPTSTEPEIAAEPVSVEPMDSGTTSLDPAMVASDPSPLDSGDTEPVPQPEAFQPPQPVGEDSMMPPTEPAAAEMPAMQTTPESQQINVTVDQPSQSAGGGSSVPSFLSQPKPAEQPAAQSVPPAVPGSDSAPGGPAPVVVHTPKKSRMILIAVIILLLLAGGAAAYYFLVYKDKPAETTSNANSSQSNDEQNNDEAEDAPAPAATAVTAANTSDFDAVCDGGAVSNASDYTDNKSAVIYAFRNKPITPDSWSSILVGYGKSYYLEDLDKFTEINTVACLKFDDSNSGQGISCEYENSQGTTVAITYKPLKYTLTLHEAKTGKQIGDSQQIDGPATECPSSVLYDQETKTGYADPDEDQLEAALDTFVR